MQIDWAPLDFAVCCNDKVKKEEVKATLMGKYSLLVAAQAGTAEFVMKHIAQGAHLAARDGCRRTALVLSCAHGHELAAENERRRGRRRLLGLAVG